ncbi:MAG TPA: hypothetical protein VGM60_15190, partial [Pseudonocardia sp.]|uniref:hypothetical protein n=1 Tax=Pseudonocardia sp. TaxID=60912 RepID=UPI002F41A333
VQALTSLVTDRTVVMTTHRPALTRLATRVVHLANGALTDEPIDPALRAPERSTPNRRVGEGRRSRRPETQIGRPVRQLRSPGLGTPELRPSGTTSRIGDFVASSNGQLDALPSRARDGLARS